MTDGNFTGQRPGPSRWAADTVAIHSGATASAGVAPPIYQTSTYQWPQVENGLSLAHEQAPTEFYARWGHPNAHQLETIVAELEGAPKAIATASGTAAMTLAVQPWVKPGDHIVLARTVYGETRNLITQVLAAFGVQYTIVSSASLESFAEAIRANTRVVVIETPANPTLDCIDIAGVAQIAHAHGARLVVDSTFATPINTRPLEWGADSVVHSATKYIAGHSDVLAGILATDAEGYARAWDLLRITGPALGPFEAWLVTRGLRTLALRVGRHNSNALAVAQTLAGHSRRLIVHYPGLDSHPSHAIAKKQMHGFGGMLSVDFGTPELALEFTRKLKLFIPATSLGGVESLVQFPAMLARLTLEEQRASGVSPGLVRLSVGCEGANDLIADVTQALDR